MSIPNTLGFEIFHQNDSHFSKIFKDSLRSQARRNSGRQIRVKANLGFSNCFAGKRSQNCLGPNPPKTVSRFMIQ